MELARETDASCLTEEAQGQRLPYACSVTFNEFDASIESGIPVPQLTIDGVRYALRNVDESSAEVFRGQSPGELVGRIFDVQHCEPSEFWPHLEWEVAGSPSRVGYERDIRNWRAAVRELVLDRLAASVAAQGESSRG